LSPQLPELGEQAFPTLDREAVGHFGDTVVHPFGDLGQETRIFFDDAESELGYGEVVMTDKIEQFGIEPSAEQLIALLGLDPEFLTLPKENANEIVFWGMMPDRDELADLSKHLGDHFGIL